MARERKPFIRVKTKDKETIDTLASAGCNIVSEGKDFTILTNTLGDAVMETFDKKRGLKYTYTNMLTF